MHDGWMIALQAKAQFSQAKCDAFYQQQPHLFCFPTVVTGCLTSLNPAAKYDRFSSR